MCGGNGQGFDPHPDEYLDELCQQIRARAEPQLAALQLLQVIEAKLSTPVSHGASPSRAFRELLSADEMLYDCILDAPRFVPLPTKSANELGFTSHRINGG